MTEDWVLDAKVTEVTGEVWDSSLEIWGHVGYFGGIECQGHRGGVGH